MTDLQDKWYESYASGGQPNYVLPRVTYGCVTMIWTNKTNKSQHNYLYYKYSPYMQLSDTFRPQLGHLQTLTLTLRKNT